MKNVFIGLLFALLALPTNQALGTTEGVRNKKNFDYLDEFLEHEARERQRKLKTKKRIILKTNKPKERQDTQKEIRQAFRDALIKNASPEILELINSEEKKVKRLTATIQKQYELKGKTLSYEAARKLAIKQAERDNFILGTTKPKERQPYRTEQENNNYQYIKGIVKNKTIKCNKEYQYTSRNSHIDIRSGTKIAPNLINGHCISFNVPQGFIGVVTVIPEDKQTDPDLYVKFMENGREGFKKAADKGSDIIILPQLGILGRNNDYQMIIYDYQQTNKYFKFYYHIVDATESVVIGGIEGFKQATINYAIEKILEISKGIKSDEQNYNNISNNIGRTTTLILSQLNGDTLKGTSIDFFANELGNTLRHANINPFVINIITSSVTQVMKEIYKYYLQL